jgi:hypothetical protein
MSGRYTPQENLTIKLNKIPHWKLESPALFMWVKKILNQRLEGEESEIVNSR